MHPFEHKIASYIHEHRLASPGDRIIVGLSGGADSVALVSVLSALGYECVAVHCNYHLRGDESDRDERYAHDIADRLGCTFICTDFHPSGSGIEEQCRQMRYDLFEQIMHSHDAHVIAVGHHREDNIETFMHNALRGGSSVRGLKAMLPRRDNIIRPLLDVSRDEIEAYLTDCHIGWITDSSNLSNDYTRNRLRNIVMPAIRHVEPDADARMSATITRLRDNYAMLGDYVAMLIDRYTDRANRLNISRFISGVPHPGTALFEVLNTMYANGDARLSVRQIADIIEASGKEEARLFELGDGRTLVVERGFIEPLQPSVAPVTFRLTDGLPGYIAADTIDPLQFNPSRDPDTIYIDMTAVGADAMATLRPARPADRIEPFGMRGSRSVAEIYHDAHLTLNQRRRQLILECGGLIIWVVGLRASRHYKVSPSTTRILKLYKTNG